MASAVGKLSYNQLVEKIIIYKHSTDSSRVSEGVKGRKSLILMSDIRFSLLYSKQKLLS